MEVLGIEVTETSTPKELSYKTKQKLKNGHLQNWINKPQHGYLMRSRKQILDIDQENTNKWMTRSKFSSHVEGYICAIQEEEIFTRALERKRVTGSTINPNCRLCGCTKETIQHIVASCPRLSASMYLPIRHNKVAYVIYQYIADKYGMDMSNGIQEIYTNDKIEVWWDVKIQTTTRLPHDKPDIVLWRKSDLKCFIIDIIVGLDVNIQRNITKKQDNYLLLAAELKRLYNIYEFDIVPIVVGATGLITQHLKNMLKKLDINNIEECVEKCQRNAVIGTMKIVKNFMKM